MKRVVSVFILLCSMAVTAYATTPAKGVFSVAADKKVQFADANSIYSENDLIQWANIESVKGDWDVLTSEEWSYLLASGRTNAADLNALGAVKGDSGLIILPDGWVQPAGIPEFKTVTEGIGYDKNVFDAAQWSVMENAGAVFLPCRGYGYNDPDKGNKYKEVDTKDHGAYWAKDEYDGDASHANCMRFNRELMSGDIHDFNHAEKTRYYSVILVKTVTPTILDEDDESAAFTTKLAAAKTKDFAIMHRTLKKDGTLYTLCLPFDVPDIDASPLANAEVFTFEGGTVSGATGSETLHLILSRLSGKKLTQGVPYLIRWTNTGESISYLYFYNVENWDTDTNAATDGGDETIKIHGFYYKTHITGSASSSEAHYNFFLGANNTIYWPNDGATASAKMKGFRAHFYTASGGTPSSAPIRRDMQTVWDIVGAFGTTTGVQNTEYRIQAEKLLRNGQIILVIDGKEYDLQGHQIK